MTPPRGSLRAIGASTCSTTLRAALVVVVGAAWPRPTSSSSSSRVGRSLSSGGTVNKCWNSTVRTHAERRAAADAAALGGALGAARQVVAGSPAGDKGGGGAEAAVPAWHWRSAQHGVSSSPAKDTRRAHDSSRSSRPKPAPAPWGLNYETSHAASQVSVAPKLVTPYDSRIGGSVGDKNIHRDALATTHAQPPPIPQSAVATAAAAEAQLTAVARSALVTAEAPSSTVSAKSPKPERSWSKRISRSTPSAAAAAVVAEGQHQKHSSSPSKSPVQVVDATSASLSHSGSRQQRNDFVQPNSGSSSSSSGGGGSGGKGGENASNSNPFERLSKLTEEESDAASAFLAWYQETYGEDPPPQLVLRAVDDHCRAKAQRAEKDRERAAAIAMSPKRSENEGAAGGAWSQRDVVVEAQRRIDAMEREQRAKQALEPPITMVQPESSAFLENRRPRRQRQPLSDCGGGAVQAEKPLLQPNSSSPRRLHQPTNCVWRRRRREAMATGWRYRREMSTQNRTTRFSVGGQREGTSRGYNSYPFSADEAFERGGCGVLFRFFPSLLCQKTKKRRHNQNNMVFSCLFVFKC